MLRYRVRVQHQHSPEPDVRVAAAANRWLHEQRHNRPRDGLLLLRESLPARSPSSELLHQFMRVHPTDSPHPFNVEPLCSLSESLAADPDAREILPRVGRPPVRGVPGI